jgi:hypothetical protein
VASSQFSLRERSRRFRAWLIDINDKGLNKAVVAGRAGPDHKAGYATSVPARDEGNTRGASGWTGVLSVFSMHKLRDSGSHMPGNRRQMGKMSVHDHYY